MASGGFANDNPIKKTYFKIKDGYVCIERKSSERNFCESLIKQSGQDPEIFINKVGVEMLRIRFNKIGGDLVEIKLRESEFENKKFKSWDIVFESGGELFIWSANYDGFTTTNFLNSALSMDFSKSRFVCLNPYISKKTQKPALYITNSMKIEPNHANAIQWKFSIEEMPKAEIITNKNGDAIMDANGNPMRDFALIREWIQKAVEQINTDLKLHVKPVEYGSDDNSVEPDAGDEVPF